MDAMRAEKAEMETAPATGRVFIIQKNPNLDYSDARRFGILTSVIQRDVFPDDLPSRIDKIKAVLESRMGDFDPDADYLLLTGDPVAIFLAGALLREAKQVRVLKFDREVGRYYDVAIKPAA
jgi:hypothetical protein